MIEVRNLNKTFGSFHALNDLCITVPKGAVYGLVGPNGAGKSTLIRHLTGAFRQDSGTITINGEPVYENDRIKSKIAFIPDDIFYFGTANIHDMMKFYAGLYDSFDKQLYQKLVNAFGLDEKLAIRRYSKGMQKQAAFILSISARPEIMILDEPVDGLDPVMRRQVWGLILQDVAERHTTVLISSHNLRELEDVCDHVGIMHKGKMLLERSLSELQDNVIKVQAVFRDGTSVPNTLQVMHSSNSGKIQTMIVKASQEEIDNEMKAVDPIFYDMVPLSLEEIFVYELGGNGYDIKTILL